MREGGEEVTLSRLLSREGLERIYPPCIIVMIWGVFILPSAINPNWGYLDDPTTLLNSKLLSADFHFPKPEGALGRYFPFYWLYYALLFNLFGFHPTGYYVVQALMFLLTLFLAHAVVFRITQSRLAGVLTALLVATASPVAENVFTFGKAEPKVLFYLLCAVYLFMRMEKGIHGEGKNGLISWIGITLFIAGAILTKETAALFVIFPAAGMIMTLSLNKGRNGMDRNGAKTYLFLLIGSIVAILLSRGLFYALRPPVSENIYISYSVTFDIFLKNLKFYASQQPDVLFLGLLTPVLAMIVYLQRRKEDGDAFVFTSASFLTGTAYVLGMLIWRWPLGYYLLIPASFFSIAAAIMATTLCRSSTDRYRWTGYIAVALMVLTRLYSIPYFSFIAQAQTFQDRIYSEAMDTYMKIAKPGERLLVEDWPFFAEPVTQSNILLKRIFEREGLNVEGVQDILGNMAIPAETLKLYQISAAPETNKRHPKKSDYILSITGNMQSPWVLRGIVPFLNDKGSVYKMRGLELEDIGKANLEWSGLELELPCLSPRFRTYSTGYRLYRVLDPLPAVEWEGRWADHWIGRSASCFLRISKQKREYVFNGFVTKHTVPSLLNILNDNRIIKTVSLRKSGRFSFTVEIPPAVIDGRFRIEFNTEKTFNPKELGQGNDPRNMSVRLGVKDLETADF